MPQILVWKPWRIVSSAHAPRAGSPTASRLPASHCRRVNSTRPLVITSSLVLLFVTWCPSAYAGMSEVSMRFHAAPCPGHNAHPSLLLLQVKFADARRHVVERLRDHLLEFLR